MATQLAKAYVQIIPSAKGIQNSITKEISGEASAAGTSTGGLLGGNLVKKLLGVVAAAQIGRAIAESIRQGAELEQNLGGTEAVFGKYAKQIQNDAQEAYKNMGLSASDYMATANKMGSLFMGAGLEQKRAIDLTSEAMQRAADVASVMGIDTQWAMDSIAHAAKGEFQMMDNLGVKMNATSLQAYALEKGINFKWNTATEAEKAELAMQMFMDRTSNMAGNFARESEETISGSIGMVKAAFQDFIGNLALGNDVGSQLSNLVQSLATAAGQVIPAVFNVIGGLPQAIMDAAPKLTTAGMSIINTLGEGITTMLPQLGNLAIDLLNSLSEGISTNLPTFTQNAMTWLTQFSEAFMTYAPIMLQAGIDLLQSLAQGIADSLPTLIETVPTILMNISSTLYDSLPTLLQNGVDIIFTLLQGIVAAIPTLIDEFPTICQMIKNNVMAVDWIGLGCTLITSIGDGIVSLINMLPDLLKSIGESAKTLFKNINWVQLGIDAITFIVNGIVQIGTTLGSTLLSIGEAGLNAVKNIDWSGVGGDIIDGIVKGLKNAKKKIKEYLLKIAEGALDAVKNFFGIKSPSRVFRKEVGQMLGEGLALGIMDNESLVQSAVDDLTGFNVPEMDLTTALEADTEFNNGTQDNRKVTINVYPSEGMDEKALAEAVNEQIARWTRNEGVVYA